MRLYRDTAEQLFKDLSENVVNKEYYSSEYGSKEDERSIGF